MFSEFQNGYTNIHVRDTGAGFPDEDRQFQVEERLVGRLESVGGLVEIESTSTGPRSKSRWARPDE